MSNTLGKDILASTDPMFTKLKMLAVALVHFSKGS